MNKKDIKNAVDPDKIAELFSLFDQYDIKSDIRPWRDGPSGWSGNDIVVSNEDGFSFTFSSITSRTNSEIYQCINKINKFYAVRSIKDAEQFMKYIGTEYRKDA